MMFPKPFQNRTLPSEKRTVFCLILLMVVLLSFQTAYSRGYPLKKTRKGPIGFVVFPSSKEWEDTGHKVAQLLEQKFREKEYVIDQVTFNDHKSHTLLRPETAKGNLKRAWEAYYRLELSQALNLLKKERKFQKDNGPPLAEQVLFALVRFAQGHYREARNILRDVRQNHQNLNLPSDVYPPRFIKLFKRDFIDPLPVYKSLASARQRLVAFARKKGWKRVCAMRVISVGWNGRLEWQCFNRRRSDDTSIILEIERGGSLSSVVEEISRRISL